MNKYRVEVIFKTFVEVDAESELDAYEAIRGMGSEAIQSQPTFYINYYYPDSAEDVTEVDKWAETTCPLCGNQECDGAGTDGAACEFTDDDGNVYETRSWWRKDE